MGKEAKKVSDRETREPHDGDKNSHRSGGDGKLNGQAIKKGKEFPWMQ